MVIIIVISRSKNSLQLKNHSNFHPSILYIKPFLLLMLPTFLLERNNNKVNSTVAVCTPIPLLETWRAKKPKNYFFFCSVVLMLLPFLFYFATVAFFICPEGSVNFTFFGQETFLYLFTSWQKYIQEELK